MIHMIFELLVSSARNKAYISESPGACAVVGIAASSKKQITHAHTLATVPPPCLQILMSGNIPARFQPITHMVRSPANIRSLVPAGNVPAPVAHDGRILGGRRPYPLSSFEVSIFQSPLPAPPAQLQRDSHAGIAQFVRMNSVGHRPRH